MVDITILQSISYIAGALGVCVAAVYYMMTLKAQQNNMKQTLETRQAQILMSLYSKFQDPEFADAWEEVQTWEWKDYDDFTAKYGRKSSPEKYRQLTVIGNFFEGLGVLVKRGFIDPTLVDDLMSMYVIGFWQKMEPYLREVRVRLNSPTTAEYMEYLYDVIYKIWMQQHPETPKPFSQ